MLCLYYDLQWKFSKKKKKKNYNKIVGPKLLKLVLKNFTEFFFSSLPLDNLILSYLTKGNWILLRNEGRTPLIKGSHW